MCVCGCICTYNISNIHIIIRWVNYFLMDLGTTVSASHGEDHGVADEPLKITVTLYQSLFIQNSI